MEIHRHPALTRMWAPVGQQPQVPAPGQNEKVVVYGGIDYKTGKLTYTIAQTKCGAEFLAFLIVLVAKYAGRKIRMVCDNGRFHHTKPVQLWLEAHREQIEIFWLPPYSPSLNLIERFWGHLKRTILANVLYTTLDDLIGAFKTGVKNLTKCRNHMGFMFDHDELVTKKPRNCARNAA
jgi:transposase